MTTKQKLFKYFRIIKQQKLINSSFAWNNRRIKKSVNNQIVFSLLPNDGKDTDILSSTNGNSNKTLHAQSPH